MKILSIFLGFGFLLAAQAQAWTSGQMTEASRASSEQIKALYGEGSVLAYRAQKVDQELLVDVLAKFDGESFAVTYDCHTHGDHMDCHDLYDQVFQTQLKTSTELSFLRAGEHSALELVSDRLKDKLTSYKVWAFENGDVDHGGELEAWVRFDFDLDGSSRHFFVMCHEHGHESAGDDHDHDDDHDDHDLDCHVQRSAAFEPAFPEL